MRYFPNPFFSSTQIEIDNPQGLEAKIEIYNVQGQQVASKHFESGKTLLNYTWDAKDNTGNTINNGLYLFTVSFMSLKAHPKAYQL